MTRLISVCLGKGFSFIFNNSDYSHRLVFLFSFFLFSQQAVIYVIRGVYFSNSC